MLTLTLLVHERASISTAENLNLNCHLCSLNKQLGDGCLAMAVWLAGRMAV